MTLPDDEDPMIERGSEETRWEMAARRKWSAPFGGAQRKRQLTGPSDSTNKDLGQAGTSTEANVSHKQRAAEGDWPAGRDLPRGGKVGEEGAREEGVDENEAEGEKGGAREEEREGGVWCAE